MINCCLQVENEVCGTDGRTYMNECWLQTESCYTLRPIAVAWRGSCGALSIILW